MATSFTYGLEDDYGHKSYHGATVAAALTTAQVTTFVGAAIIPLSDAKHIQSAVKLTADITGTTTTGTTGVERRGTIIMKNSVDGRRFVITIPAIKADMIEPNGAHKSGIIRANCDTAITAFNTLTTLSCVYVSSYADGSQFQR